MGTRFRKSVNLGPLKINLSKSGVGYSVGTKGYRVTKRADGKVQRTASLPGTGISHVKTLDGKETEKKNRNDKKSGSGGMKKGALIALAILVLAGVASCGGEDHVPEEENTPVKQEEVVLPVVPPAEEEAAPAEDPEEEAASAADSEPVPAPDPEHVQEPEPEPQPEPELEQQPTSRTVYITKTGKRYHYDSTCGNGDYSPTDLDHAKSIGLTPCKKCAGG